MIMGKI